MGSRSRCGIAVSAGTENALPDAINLQPVRYKCWLGITKVNNTDFNRLYLRSQGIDADSPEDGTYSRSALL